MNPNTQSPRWSLNQVDVQKWAMNTVVFFAPVAVIYLGFVVESLKTGFSWNAFVPNNAVAGMIALYVVNTLYDITRKFVAGSTTTQPQ